jgi:phenylacetate-CoA ligase
LNFRKTLHREVRKLEALRSEISRAVNSILGISAEIKLTDPKSLERFEGKAKRVIDKRNLID